MNILKIRKRGRAALTALVLGGVVAALAACDSDFTATVSSDQTVSGSLTVLVDQEAWDSGDTTGEGYERGYVEGMFADAFPESSISQGTQGDQYYDRVSFTGISFEAFEHGIDVILGDGDGADGTQVDLTSTDGTYQFDATSIGGFSGTSYGDPTMDRLVLTFPTKVSSTNGVADGDTVTWDFLSHPDLTEMHATAASAPTTVPTTPTNPTTVKPTPTVSVAAGSLAKHGKARVGHRVSVTAPKALTAGTTVRYAWTVAGKKVGTAPSYKIGKKQAGKRLAVTVTYTKAGYKAVAKSVSFGKIKR